MEIVVWRVPKPVPPSEHPFKYRLAYIVAGKRVVGYDNERGKGDHKHLAGREEPYHFNSPDQLVADFWRDVMKGAVP
ncbi:MAG: toxin-antitoxin system TumE family protein [Burkholderiales bacterium]